VPDLFRRQWAVTVGSIRVEGLGAGDGLERAGLDVSFEVESSTSREPNTCSVKIYNLAPDHRRALASAAVLPIRVEAGYAESVTTLFDGDVRVAESRVRAASHRKAQSRLGALAQTVDLVDIVTEVEAEDGGRAWRTATVLRSFARGTPVSSVLDACVAALGVGRGNLDEFDAEAALNGGDVRTYGEGTVLAGDARREVDRIVRSCGLTWSVQGGAFQLMRAGRALATRATLLNSGTGLVGSPAVDAEGYVTATSLLNGNLYPGRPVVLQAREIEGSYKVKKVRHVGETFGVDWSSEVTLEAR
jgi:hypothetical protein